MSITSGASPGVVVTSSAKSGTVKSFTGGLVRLEDPITTGNNGNLMTSPTYSGRLITIDGGTGSGQTRFITVETLSLGDGDDVDLTVNEPWTTSPDGTSTYQISYIIEDAATLTGLTLVTKTNVYESGRHFTVGSGGGTFAYFFLAGDKAFEWDDQASTTVAGFTVEDGARFDCGYDLAGAAVSGGYSSSVQNVDGELSFDCKSNSTTNLYDWNLRCTRANTLSQVIGGTHIWHRGKTFRAIEACTLSGNMTIKDWVWEGNGTSTSTIRLESTVLISSCTLIAADGFISNDDAVAEEITVRNCNIVNPVARIVRVNDDKIWNFVDPSGWISDSTALSFEIDDLNEVNKLHILNISVTTPAGVAIAGAETFVYEGLLNDDLPTKNKQTTDISGESTCDVLEEKYTFPSSVFTTATSGDHAVKVYSWLKTPFVSAQTFDDTLALQGLTLPISLSTDPSVLETTENLAVENGPDISSITKHGTGETDTRAIKVMHFDTGTGSVPTIGETMTQGSATGDVLDYEGDAVSGILVLENWNGTEFTNNTTVTGGTSTFSATTDVTGDVESFYQEYTWVWDLAGKSMQASYDYQAAKFAARRHPISFQDDAGVFTTFTNEAKDETTADIDLLPVTPAQNDAFYFGDVNFPFEQITIDISTAATTSTITWEYWNGSSWTALSSVTDDTTNLTVTGKNTIDYTLPSDWVSTTINSQAAYWVRARQSNASPSGQALASQIWLDELIERLIEWGQDEHTYQMTVSPNGYRTSRNITNIEGVWLANRGAGTIEGMTSDAGTDYIPPVSRTITYTGLTAGTEVRIFNLGTGVEIDGIESSGTSFAHSYIYSSDISIYTIIQKFDKVWQKLNGTLDNSDQTIIVIQRDDIDALNP